MAERESARRSERIRAGLARRRAEDPDYKGGRKKGTTDKTRCNRSGYVKAREQGGACRAAAEQKQTDGA
jgi:hypothetical protein